MKKIFILFVLMVLCSCSGWGDAGKSYHEHFITDYFTYNNINVEIRELPVVPEWGEEYNHKHVVIYADVDDCYHYYETEVSRKAIYEHLAEKYGDVGFNRYIESPEPHREKYAAESIVAIELICLEGIDEAHPANSSVTDMFKFESRTLSDFILSRYDDEQYYKWVNKELNEVTTDDLYLIGFGGVSYGLFFIAPLDQDNCPAWGKKLRLTLYFEDQYPISKDFILKEGEY